MNPSDTLRDTLRACIADRNSMTGYCTVNGRAEGQQQEQENYRALLAAFAEWEKAPAPLFENAERRSAGIQVRDARIKQLKEKLVALEKAPAPASSRLREAAKAVCDDIDDDGFSKCATNTHSSVKSKDGPWPALVRELRDALAAEPEAPEPVEPREYPDDIGRYCNAKELAARCAELAGRLAQRVGTSLDFTSLQNAGWSSPQRTAELQARIDKLSGVEARAISLTELQRAELAEARVKELEGELREAKALSGSITVEGSKVGKWHVAVSDQKPPPQKVIARIYRFIDETGVMRFAADIEVERLASGCEIYTFRLEGAEFADAVAKLAEKKW